MFWPFLRRSPRAPTMKAVRGAIAIEGMFDKKSQMQSVMKEGMSDCGLAKVSKL